jgi:hypothetical protein
LVRELLLLIAALGDIGAKRPQGGGTPKNRSLDGAQYPRANFVGDRCTHTHPAYVGSMGVSINVLIDLLIRCV